ncbi:transcriptional regulator Myc-like [Poecilia reticulata]|uniref:MYC proto-oncogene, bHLH transcription factor n=1 Tax=Poecilia reticulata TaxID=8081 RepID=A0A3P9NAH7_POERE|nr:PREDICTED: transcriptional regulator Myc-like [Poecilia reticulata]
MREVRLDAVIQTESRAEENINNNNNNNSDNNNNHPVIDRIRRSANFPLKILTFFFRNFEYFCSEAAMMAAMLATPPAPYDFDSMQPCFFLGGDDEDVFPSQLLPGPGEDIWKKFELLPTPPMSPSRTPPRSDLPLSAADHLAALSDLLDEELRPSAALQSFIIQDCMWSSSFAAAAKLERAVTERLECLRARQNPTGTSGLAAGSGAREETGYLQDLQGAAAACIDPSEVLPFTPTGQNQNLNLNQDLNHDSGVAMEVGSELSLETPPLSSSSESEEEEEDGEEEEIDVVTVDRRRTSHRSPLVLKRSLISIQQHNYAAPQPAGKRPKPTESPAMSPLATAKQRSGGRRCWSPRSDDEDEDRRRTHNVLERQRRSELRLSLLALREQVPALAANPKAAKVSVLQGATAFIREAQADERRLLKKKDELTKRSRELQRRLERLRTLHSPLNDV